MPARKLVGIACTVVAAVALAGCAVTAHDSPADPGTSSGGSANPRPLPLQSYLFTNGQTDLVQHADDLLVAQCMAKLGFSYQVPPPVDPANQLSPMDGRYGVIRPTEAAYGYRYIALRIKRNEDTRAAAVRAGDNGKAPAPMSQAMRQALGTNSNGTGNGCRGEALRELGGNDNPATIGYSMTVQKLLVDSFVDAQSTPQVRKAFQDWSSCMRAVGYQYPDPNAAENDRRWHTNQPPSRLEIATAQADVTCKTRTNLVATWRNAEVADEKAQIAQHRPELNDELTRISQEIARATAVVGRDN